MAGLIRLILIFLVIYLGFRYVLKPLFKMLLQYLVKSMVDKSMEDLRRQQGNQRGPERPEGSIYVDYVPGDKTKKPPKRNDEGEYVDFEEVKD